MANNQGEGFLYLHSAVKGEPNKDMILAEGIAVESPRITLSMSVWESRLVLEALHQSIKLRHVRGEYQPIPELTRVHERLTETLEAAIIPNSGMKGS